VIEPAAVARPRSSATLRGHRYVAVLLTIRNVGRTAYKDNPGRETALLSGKTGGYVGSLVRRRIVASFQCSNSLFREIHLAAGGVIRGCVPFRVPGAQRIDAVQFRTHGGADDDIATWAIDSSKIHG
jgi:hypothetical protein